MTIILYFRKLLTFILGVNFNYTLNKILNVSK